MTPRELRWESDSARKRMEDALDKRVALAWEIERVRVLSGNAAHRKQPMPALQSVLHRQSKESLEMRKALKHLANYHGIPIKTVVH